MYFNFKKFDLNNEHCLLIKERCLSGHPPVNAEHLHNFRQHLNAFPHPCPTDRTTSGGTLPTSSHTITEDLQGLYYFIVFF